MRMQREYTVKAIWDDEAHVFTVIDSNVPGLAAEAATYEELLSCLQIIIPELLELNGDTSPVGRVPIELLAQQHVCA